MDEQQTKKWADLISAVTVIAKGTNFKKVNLQTGLGIGLAVLPFFMPFLSHSQQATTAVAASGLTSLVAAITNTQKS